jgi:preprotein translocase subunit SecD
MKTALTAFLFLFTLTAVSIAHAKPLLLHVEKASAGLNADAFPAINIILTKASGKQFEKFTKTHIGRRINVSANGKILTSPLILDAIPGGKLQISGLMTATEVAELADAMNIKNEPLKIELVK